MTDDPRDGAVVLFDGLCLLCQGSVRFIVERDSHRRFRFAPLQSRAGRQRLDAHELPPESLDTLVLIEEGRAFTRSTAALRIARHLDGPWRLAALLLVVPVRVRDAVYSFVARRRHTWFGRAESCGIPSPDLAARLLPGADEDVRA